MRIHASDFAHAPSAAAACTRSAWLRCWAPPRRSAAWLAHRSGCWHARPRCWCRWPGAGRGCARPCWVGLAFAYAAGRAGAGAARSACRAGWNGMISTSWGRSRACRRCAPDAVRFVLRVQRARLSGHAFPLHGRLHLAWYGAPTAASRPCTRWHLRVRLRRPRGSMDPGAYRQRAPCAGGADRRSRLCARRRREPAARACADCASMACATAWRGPSASVLHGSVRGAGPGAGRGRQARPARATTGAWHGPSACRTCWPFPVSISAWRRCWARCLPAGCGVPGRPWAGALPRRVAQAWLALGLAGVYALLAGIRPADPCARC